VFDSLCGQFPFPAGSAKLDILDNHQRCCDAKPLTLRAQNTANGVTYLNCVYSNSEIIYQTLHKYL
jgi:hypothetical protein